MTRRPLVFIVLGILLLLEPFLRIITFSISLNISIYEVFKKALILEGLREIFDFWFLFPLSGLALLSVQKFGYRVFMGLQIYSIITHISYSKYTSPYSEEFSNTIFMIFLSINILIIFYFLFPDVRRPFFDESIQWWKRRPRFKYRMPCTLTINNPDKIIDTEILSISHSGCFVKLSDSESFYDLKADPDDFVKLHIAYQEFNIILYGNIVNLSIHDQYRGLGIKFIYKNIWENLQIRKLIKKVALKMELENIEKSESNDNISRSA